MSLENTRKRRLSRRMVLLLLALVVAVLGALGYLLSLFLRSGPQFMVVESVDSQGRLTRLPQVVRIPAPDHMERDGLSHLPSYVSRLLASKARFTSLMVFSPDHLRGVGLHFTGGQASIGLTVDWRQYPAQEQAIRSLFSSLQIAPSQDYLAQNGSVANATRVLQYPLPGGATKAAAICKRVLREVYGLSDQEALDYTYQEHP